MENKIKILVSFGTRPEAIKLAPVIKEIKKEDHFEIIVCSTGQHRQMLSQVVDFFEISPDIDLDLMADNQSLTDISAKIMNEMEKILIKIKPDMVLVQGDTTTAFLTALISFYNKIAVGHIEAGLRTCNKFNPFPEEINRQLLSKVADLHFAPTTISGLNLKKEGIEDKKIIITGNTIVDAIMWGTEIISKQLKNSPDKEIQNIENLVDFNKKIILVTMHRRESFGKDIENVCEALKYIAESYKNIEIVYPVHLNPNVRNSVNKLLYGIDNIKLLEPLGYRSFLWLMQESYFIITDSGGIQEEAPTLKKPVLVIRNYTERSESIKAGISKLIGTDKDNIIKNVRLLLDNEKNLTQMISTDNPYGDGKASVRICNAIKNYFIQNHYSFLINKFQS